MGGPGSSRDKVIKKMLENSDLTRYQAEAICTRAVKILSRDDALIRTGRMDVNYERISKNMGQWIKEVGGAKRAAWLLGQMKGREPVDKERWQVLLEQISKFDAEQTTQHAMTDEQAKKALGGSLGTNKEMAARATASAKPKKPLQTPEDLAKIKKAQEMMRREKTAQAGKAFGQQPSSEKKPRNFTDTEPVQKVAPECSWNRQVPGMPVPGGMPRVPDGTGPHGRGMGPGQGRADGSGMQQQQVATPEERQPFGSPAPGADSAEGMPPQQPGALPEEQPPTPTESAPESPTQDFKAEEIEMAMMLKRAGFNHTQFTRALYNLGVLASTAEALWGKITEADDRVVAEGAVEGAAENNRTQSPMQGAAFGRRAQ